MFMHGFDSVEINEDIITCPFILVSGLILALGT